MTAKMFKNYLTIKNSGKTTFYADEFGFNGGEINSLSHIGLITPTGNTREVFVEMPYGDEVYRKVLVKEWKIDSNINGRAVSEFREIFNSIIDNKDFIMVLLKNSDILSYRLDNATKSWHDCTPFDKIFGGIEF
jgi:hypothetical protein